MCSQTKLDRGIICNQLMQKKKSNKQNELLTVCWWLILALRKMPLPLLKQTVHMQFTYFSIINIKIMHTISPFILLTYMYTNFQCLFVPELDSFHFYGLAGLVSGCRRRNCSFLSFSIKPPKFWSIFFLSSLLLYIPGEEDWRVVNKLWLYYFIQLPSKSQFAPNT